MSETAIVGENVEIIQTQGGPRPAFSWSVVIAGALAAWAVAFLVISLGTGVGLSITSPYSGAGASASTMGILGAVWLLFAETLAFTTGGYLAGRLRTNYHVPGPETRFRDAAHGFMAWVVGVALMALAVASAGAFGLKTVADAAGLAGGAAAVAGASQQQGNDNNVTGYYVDSLFRGPAGAQPVPSQQNESRTLSGPQRGEVTRIMAASLRDGKLSDADRDYLAQMVSQRTGMPQEEAAKRVTEVQNQAAATARDAAEKARKAGAYLSFWSFMALLFGAMAGTLGGIVGGDLRDDI